MAPQAFFHQVPKATLEGMIFMEREKYKFKKNQDWKSIN